MVTTSGCVLTRCKVRTGDCYCPTTGNGARRGWGTDGSTDYWMERLVESWFGVPLGCGCFRQPLGRLSLCHRHVSLRRPSESLSFLVAVCVVRTWNLGHYSFYASYLAVTFPVCGCCLWSTALDFSVTFPVFGRISHIFHVAADSNPDCVPSTFGLNGEESMLLDAVLLRAVRTWNTGRFSRASRG